MGESVSKNTTVMGSLPQKFFVINKKLIDNLQKINKFYL